MPLKVDNPRDIDSSYDDLFDLEKRAGEPNTAADYAAQDQRDAAVRNSNAQDLGEVARVGEQNTTNAWENNTTKRANDGLGAQGMNGIAQKGKVIFQKKGATIAIITVLGGGGAIPFLSAGSLPFAIVGNMNAKSMLLGLDQYNKDFMGFKFFGSQKASVQNGAKGKLEGLNKAEIEQLKKNNVSFKGEKYNKITKKTTFSAIQYEKGGWINAGKEFDTEMRKNPAFRRAMVYTKSSYWKANKSAAAAKVKSLFKLNPNPDITGEDDTERNKKMYAESVDGSEGSLDSRVNNQDPEDKSGKGNGINDIAGEAGSEIAENRAAFAEGDIASRFASESDMGNIATQLDKPSLDAIEASTGIGSKIWSFVNVLDPIDMVCTTYQVAHTAEVLARGVALANIVKFASNIATVIDRAKAGDDDGESLKYLMQMLQQKDPETGRSFDATSYAAFLFSGQLSSEPSSVNAFGGQAMVALMMSMYSLHSLAGGGDAATGRKVIRDGCNIATNMGVQIVATVGSLVASVFSGGTAAVGVASAKAFFTQGVKVAAKKVGEVVVKKFGKEAIKTELEKVSTQGFVKYFARNAWRGFKGAWGAFGPWDKIGFMFAAVSTFGMPYIVNALSGGNIAGFLKNGVTAFEGLGTGNDKYESMAAIAAGGTIGTYATAAAYQKTQDDYRQQYVADMQYDAKDTPLDLKTPYSALGSAVMSMQKVIGISASMNMLDTITSVASLPLRLPSLGSIAKADDTQLTPEAIGEEVGDPFSQENQIALTRTGSPQVVFNKTMSFETFLDTFVDNASPQVSYDGDDETTGEPKFTIIAGSDLEKYTEECHNPETAEPNPEYRDDDFDYKSTCIDNAKPAYDDVQRFINQVSPDVQAAAGGSGSGAIPSISGLPAGGVKDTDEGRKQGWAMAEQFIKDLNTIRKGGSGYPFKDITDDSLGYGKSAGTPGNSASGGPCFNGASNCDQCYALTAWFLDKFTSQKIGTTTGSGDGVVAYLKKQGIPTGNEAKVYSVFSYGRAVDGSGAHTGIVIGIDGDYAITLENNFAFNGTLYLNKRPKNGADFRGNGSRTEFAYINDVIKDTPKKY